MTPEQRRAKYPVPGAWQPLTEAELAQLRHDATEWLERPPFTERGLDLSYRTYSRLLATIDQLKEGTR